MDGPTDAELMVRVSAGDHEAFALLVDRHKDALVNYLTHITGHRDRAEDCAQGAFVRLWELASRYREEGKFAPYLYRIATNLARNEASRTRVRNLLLLRFGDRPEREPAVLSPLAVVQQNELQREVVAALRSLPLSCRAAVVLREVHGWSYVEIAGSLGCSEGTVKSRISRGRDFLRRRLLPWWKGTEGCEPRRAY
jgi:RNA polymerase sigma-70 factor (ECF subfamily)